MTRYEQKSIGRVGIGMSLVLFIVFTATVHTTHVLFPLAAVLVVMGAVAIGSWAVFGVQPVAVVSGVLLGAAGGVVIRTATAPQIHVLSASLGMVLLGIITVGLVNLRYRTLIAPPLFALLTAALLLVV